MSLNIIALTNDHYHYHHRYYLIIILSGMSIIITTHYIEEARDAHVVGIMRGGRLLAQVSVHMNCTEPVIMSTSQYN